MPKELSREQMPLATATGTSTQHCLCHRRGKMEVSKSIETQVGRFCGSRRGDAFQGLGKAQECEISIPLAEVILPY